MNDKDWKGAFGPTPEAFKQKISFTLRKVEEEKPVKKIKAATVAAIALIVLLLAAVAYAAATQWGIFSFLEYRYGRTMLPEAKDAIQTDLPQTGGEENADVTFKVREALSDGMRLNVIIEARPKDAKKILLLGPDQMPEDRPSYNGPVYEGDDRTFAQAAAQDGKRLMNVSLSVKMNDLSITDTIDYLQEEDGTLVFHLSGPLATNEKTLGLTCDYALTQWQDAQTALHDQIVRGQFSFKLPATVHQTQKQYSGPVTIEQTGVTVDKIVLTKTDAGIYGELIFSIAPDATQAQMVLARERLWFEYLDEQGQHIDLGVSSEGGIDGLALPDGTKSDTTFVQTESLNLTELPGSVTVRGYDCWEKTRFGQHTFTADE